MQVFAREYYLFGWLFTNTLKFPSDFSSYSFYASFDQLDNYYCYVIIIRWLEEEARRGSYDVTIANETDTLGCLGLAGPSSRQVLGPLIDDLGSDDLSDYHWPFLHARRVTIAGIPTTAVRISYTGELGWELYARLDHLPALYDALVGLPKPTVTPVIDFGTYALNALRLEKGFRAWGSEMNVDVNPFEAGLDAFIRIDKGDFIGREAARRARADGQRRRLVTLSIADSGPDQPRAVDPNGNEAVWYGCRVVGNTTSGAYCPTVGRSLAFAYLPSELTAPGTEVRVELLGEQRRAVVEKGSLVKVDSVRTRSINRRKMQQQQQQQDGEGVSTNTNN